MSVIFDSLRTQNKYPTGCLKVGERLYLKLMISKQYNPRDVSVVFKELWSDKVFTMKMDFFKEENDVCIFTLETVFSEKNIYRYYFSFKDSQNNFKFVKRRSHTFEGEIRESDSNDNWQLTVYQPVEAHPNMQEGVMYQILPDRFAKYGEEEDVPDDRIYRNWGEKPYFRNENIAQDFFGGNLDGITYHLRYLKSLGVSAIYLNPIWLSHSNHRYDTADYRTVDTLLGNENKLRKLIKKAHDYGIIVIIDTVLNHTGADSIYFNKNARYPVIGAYNSPYSNYYGWYYFNKYPDVYESWWGFTNLPKINQEAKSFQDFMFGENGTLDYWYSLGIDGLRLDVADELPNSVLEKIYSISKKNRKMPIIIVEVWEDASCKINYGHRMEYLLGNQCTSVMNYPVRNAILAYVRYGSFWSDNLKETLQTIFIENYPREIAYSLMNFLSTHDTVRAITKLVGPEVDEHDREWQNLHDELSKEEYLIGRKRLIISYLMMYFLPGIPSIFYGDEVGIAGQKDPFCRKCYTWNKRDKKLLRFFKRLGKLRTSEKKFFANADFKVINIDNEVCILERRDKKRTLLLIINRCDYTVDISKYTSGKEHYRIVFSTSKNVNVTHVNSCEGMILEIS